MFRNPAFWSAVAAMSSASAALILLLIQRRNLIESVRPVIMLDGWERREGRGAHSVEVVFKKVRNVGRGPAFHLYMNAGWMNGNLPVAFMSTFRWPLVPSNDSIDVENTITVYFQNSERGRSSLAPVKIDIFFRDSRGRAHVTVFELMIIEDPNQAPGNQLAPGIMLGTWNTRVETIFRRKVRGRVQRIPLLRRFAKKD